MLKIIASLIDSEKFNSLSWTEYDWLKDLVEIIEKNENPEDSYEYTKLQMFQENVFCFTPKGSIIKFIYSEFKDEMARDAFTREFEIDLNDGNTVAYKGCVFEIIKVDNATITYKVIRHFES